jgi:hypothetical protein
LVRVVAGAPGRVGDRNIVHGGDGLGMRVFGGDSVVGEDGFGDLIPDAHNWIERGHRLLKNHGKARAADVAHVLGWELEEVFWRTFFTE